MAGPDQPQTLAEFNADGALREVAEEAASSAHTRSAFFKRGGLLAAGGVAVGAIPAGFAIAQGGLPKGDIDILNYALTLEYLEAAFYKKASAGKLSGEAAKFASTVGAHEQAHVEALKKVLGSKAVASPKFSFGDGTSEAKFLATAQVLETTGVSAYQGQATEIKTPAVLASAGAILAVEARHAAWVTAIIGKGLPAPAAFSTAKSMKDILAAVKGTGFIKG
jgi:rubrerythrin